MGQYEVNLLFFTFLNFISSRLFQCRYSSQSTEMNGVYEDALRKCHGGLGIVLNSVQLVLIES